MVTFPVGVVAPPATVTESCTVVPVTTVVTTAWLASWMAVVVVVAGVGVGVGVGGQASGAFQVLLTSVADRARL